MHGKEVHKGRATGSDHQREVEGGETYREIGASLGLTRAEVRGAMHRHHAKERKLAAGHILRPKGRPRKDADNEEVKRNNEVIASEKCKQKPPFSSC